MLTSIKLENFMSFRNPTVIDVSATNYKMLMDSNVSNNILKGLIFVGGNATGKTNAITSIRLLLQMLFSIDKVNTINYFCFFSSSELMKLEFTFKFGKDVIVYYFSINKKPEIMEEKLLLNKETLLDRIKNSAKSNITEKIIYDESDIDSNTLFLRNIYFNTKFKGFSPLEKWFEFLENSFYLNPVEKITEGIVNTKDNVIIYSYLENKGPEKINNFFSSFGFNLEVIYDNKHVVYKGVEAENQKNKEIFLKRHNMNLWIPFAFESLGNKTLINMLPAFLHVVDNNGMLLIDEFSSAFHNELEELLVRYFMNNSKQSQLFIVSHSTNLLSTTLLRPDQIYSTNFEDENGSKLKRFSSEGPRLSQNLEKMYLSGIFEGLPRYKNEWNRKK